MKCPHGIEIDEDFDCDECERAIVLNREPLSGDRGAAPPTPSHDAIAAAFLILYDKKGGAPTSEMDGPELALVERLLEAAYAVDFPGSTPLPPTPDQEEK